MRVPSIPSRAVRAARHRVWDLLPATSLGIQREMQRGFTSGGRQIGLDVVGETRGSAGKRPALVLLHGSGGNVGFWLSRLEPALAESGILLFAPHYFDRTGTVRADLATITDLQRLGVPHETKILPKEGHWFSAGAQWQLLLAVSAFLSRYLKT